MSYVLTESSSVAPTPRPGQNLQLDPDTGVVQNMDAQQPGLGQSPRSSRTAELLSHSEMDSKL